MIFIQIVCVIIILLGFMLLSAQAQKTELQKADVAQEVTSEKVQAMSREDIQRALQKIGSSVPPPEKMGAMCYDMVDSQAQEGFMYVCPVEGEKTVYSRNSNAFWQAKALDGLRNLVAELRPLANGITVSLDEHGLCIICSPGLSDKERSVALVLQYDDGRTVRTDGVTSEDLRYLIGFFTDGLSYKTSNDGQEPLKPVEARLKQLLGEN